MNKHEFDAQLAARLREQQPGTVALFTGFGAAFLSGGEPVYRRLDGSPLSTIGNEVGLNTLWEEHAAEMQAWLDEPEFGEGFKIYGSMTG